MILFAAIGLVAGVLGGLLGVGGGFVIVPLQVTLARISQHTASGTSLAALVPISVAGALVYFFAAPRPQVDVRFALLVVAGSVLGTYAGARSMTRVGEGTLRRVAAALLLAVGLKELFVP